MYVLRTRRALTLFLFRVRSLQGRQQRVLHVKAIPYVPVHSFHCAWGVFRDMQDPQLVDEAQREKYMRGDHHRRVEAEREERGDGDGTDVVRQEQTDTHP